MSEEVAAQCFTAGFYASDLFDEIKDSIIHEEEFTRELRAKINMLRNITAGCIDHSIESYFIDVIDALENNNHHHALKRMVNLASELSLKFKIEKQE